MKEIPTSSHPNIIQLSSNGIVVRLLSFADIHWQHTFPVAIMFQIFFKIILISVQLLGGSFSFGQEWFECQQQCKSFNNIQHKEHQMRALHVYSLVLIKHSLFIEKYIPIYFKTNRYKIKPNFTWFLNISNLKTNRIRIRYLSKKLIFPQNQKKKIL
jgi:hypothetical protein